MINFFLVCFYQGGAFSTRIDEPIEYRFRILFGYSNSCAWKTFQHFDQIKAIARISFVSMQLDFEIESNVSKSTEPST